MGLGNLGLSRPRALSGKWSRPRKKVVEAQTTVGPGSPEPGFCSDPNQTWKFLDYLKFQKKKCIISALLWGLLPFSEF